MSGLTLFILRSGNPDADTKRALESFANEKITIRHVFQVNSTSDINGHFKPDDWFFVIYNDEIVGENLMSVLDVYLSQSKSDALILYKKNGASISRCPRIFRKHIKLMPDSLMPENKSIKFDTVLDGWVKGVY